MIQLLIHYYCYSVEPVRWNLIWNAKNARVMFQYPIRRLIVRSCKVSKTRDLYLELSTTLLLMCLSKRYKHFNPRSHAFETLWDLTIWRLIGSGNGAQVAVWAIPLHDDVIKWKHFPRYWPFVRGIHRSPVNSPHKGQWRGALMFSLICAWINGWVNNREACDLRRHHAHYDVIVMHVMICMPEAGIKGRDKELHPTDTVRCNYLSLPLMPASGTQVSYQWRKMVIIENMPWLI